MTIIAALISGLLAISLRRRYGGLHPAFIMSGVWAAAFGVFSLTSASLGLTQPSFQAVFLITLGVAAFCVVPLTSSPRSPTNDEVGYRKPILGFWTLAVFVLFAIGFLAFTRGIGSASGSDFGQLTLTQVRSFQTAEDRSGGGLVGLLYSLAPLSASLFVLSGRVISRSWYVGVVPVALLVLQSPARIAGLTAFVTTMLFLAFVRKGTYQANGLRSLSARQLAVFLVALALTIGYFVAVGSALGKDRIDPILLPPPWLPSPLVSPVIYLTGGIPALSYAQGNGLEATDWGRSIFSLLRLLSAVGVPVSVPDSFGEFVPIPIPFNVFTGFGDLWLDFGFLGTVFLFFIFGLLAHRLHQSAGGGALAPSWVAALAGTFALSTPFSLRIFSLDSVFLIVCGALVFVSVQAKPLALVSTRLGHSLRTKEPSPGSLPSGTREFPRGV